MPTTLRPLQVEDLQHDSINKAMSGNAGLAIVNIKKQTGYDDQYFLSKLNRTLIEIEIKARREMKKALIDFFDTVN